MIELLNSFGGFEKIFAIVKIKHVFVSHKNKNLYPVILHVFDYNLIKIA